MPVFYNSVWLVANLLRTYEYHSEIRDILSSFSRFCNFGPQIPFLLILSPGGLHTFSIKIYPGVVYTFLRPVLESSDLIFSNHRVSLRRPPLRSFFPISKGGVFLAPGLCVGKSPKIFPLRGNEGGSS